MQSYLTLLMGIVASATPGKARQNIKKNTKHAEMFLFFFKLFFICECLTVCRVVRSSKRFGK